MFTYGPRLDFYLDRYDYLLPMYEGKVTKFEVSNNSYPLSNGLTLNKDDGGIYGVPILPMTTVILVRAYNEIYFAEIEVVIKITRILKNKLKIELTCKKVIENGIEYAETPSNTQIALNCPYYIMGRITRYCKRGAPPEWDIPVITCGKKF